MPATTVPNSILWGTQPLTSNWNPRSLFGAAFAHALLFLLIAILVAHKTGLIPPPQPATEVTLLAPPPAPPKALPRLTREGGGGGQHGPTPVTHGMPLRFAPQQLNPPKAPPLVESKINVPVTVDVDPKLNMQHADVQVGVANSPLVGLSMGNGRGTGLGSGDGAGIGPGAGGNTGGGLRRIGGGVLAPVVLFAPEPEFSEEARKAKVAGNVLVYLQVDTEGHPTHVRVLRGIGLGLDEKAVDAVRHYRFQPAQENGHPVPVEMQVEVTFQIF